MASSPSEGTTGKVADRLSQCVLSVANLADLIRNTPPTQLLQQMPGVIAALDAHLDKSLLSLAELETLVALLDNKGSNIEKPQTKEDESDQES